MQSPPTIAWNGDARTGHLALLDQTRLPHEEVVLALDGLTGVVDAIQCLAVRGAPAIGVAAAYGVVLGVRARASEQDFGRVLETVCDKLVAARPTAVNLEWAVRRMQRFAQTAGAGGEDLEPLLGEARAIQSEDEELCRRIGACGAELVQDGMTVLTHCNTGRLATAGDGTALAVLFAAHAQGKRIQVLADETRPLLQGARLTAYELARAGIPVDVVCDSAAAGLIGRGAVDLILTGADRIAANGDAANKVGTYGLALAAQAHDIPMYIAAPVSTFDLAIPDGSHIPIEDRGADEVLAFAGVRAAPEHPGVGARNPAFDVTPGRLLAGLITDRGLIERPTTESVTAMVRAGAAT